MIIVNSIENYYLREFIKQNTLKNEINEFDYIKYTIDFCIDNNQIYSMLDLPNSLSKFGIIMEQYLTKDNIYKYSYKTERIEYGVSEEKLGDYYSNISLRNRINFKHKSIIKHKKKKQYTIKDYIDYKNKLLEILKLDNDIVNEMYNSSYYLINEDNIRPFVLYDMLNDLKYDNDTLNEYEDIKNIVKEANRILPDNSYVYICDTPLVFTLFDFNKYQTVETTKKYLVKSQTKDSEHSISNETLFNLKKLIENPICITDSNFENIKTLIIDDKSKNDYYLIVPISKYEDKSNNIEINKIDSIYGKRNLKNYILNHKMIAYNEIKMNKLSVELGLQLPLSANQDLFIYNDSIIDSLENVKKNGKFVFRENNNMTTEEIKNYSKNKIEKENISKQINKFERELN